MTDTRTILDAAAEHLTSASCAPAGFDHVFAVTAHPNSRLTFEDLERFAPAPRRVAATVAHETPQSFAEYVNAFRLAAQTRVFASLADLRMVARIDWHAPGDGDAPEPSWGAHVATLRAEFTEAFGAWTAVDGEWLSQREFADFLEDRAGDAETPDPATLMEVAARFEAVRTAEFTSVVNVHTNERQFRYQEKDAPGGAVTCPKAIRLFTPVFYGTDPVSWGARLAYDIDGGKLKFRVAIHRRADLLEAEFGRLCEAIAVDCPDVPVHRGKVS